jgi:endo-1,4-beta-xylanase
MYKYLYFFMIFIILILSACKTQEMEAIPTPEPEPASQTAEPAPIAEAIETEPEPTPEPVAFIQYPDNYIYIEDFTSGRGRFQPRGSAAVKVVEAAIPGTDAAHALQIYNRRETWHGAFANMTGEMVSGGLYNVSAWVKYDEGVETQPISLKFEKNGKEFLDIAQVTANKGEWIFITGDIRVPIATNRATVYFETPGRENVTDDDLCDIFVAQVLIIDETANAPEMEIEIPALKGAYADYFPIGVAIERGDFGVEGLMDLVVKHFDTLTIGNEMKPDALLNRRASRAEPYSETHAAIETGPADFIMDFAVEHGMPVRGHVLIWHSQTPHWFFREGYDLEYETPFVDRETMIQRMENYIRDVLTHFQEKYPGAIYAWDVVNEAVEPEDGLDGRFRDSLWYQVVGPDFIELAFTFARKYADPSVKLFYNDYNTFVMSRTLPMLEIVKGLKEKGLIDGMGMQSHILMDFPALYPYERTIRQFAELGVEVHITELDIKQNKDDAIALQSHGRRYAEVAAIYRKLHNQGIPITNVTIWGVLDNRSWLNKDGICYPLLFDKHLNPKPAFWGFYDPEGY